MFIGALFLMAVTPCKFPLIQTIHQRQRYDLQAFLSLQNHTAEGIYLALITTKSAPLVRYGFWTCSLFYVYI